jgi:hypothetical protein
MENLSYDGDDGFWASWQNIYKPEYYSLPIARLIMKRIGGNDA